MNPTIKKLHERRGTLVEEFEALIEPMLAEGDDYRELGADEETRKAELEGQLDALDERIDELEKLEERKAKVAEAREAAKTVLDTDMRVTDEPKVYGEGSDFSFIADLVKISTPAWPGHKAAVERMSKYEYQVACEIAQGTEEGRRAEGAVRESRRSPDKYAAREVIDELRELGRAGSKAGPEARAMTAGSSSGGSFVTPVYFIQEWAPYRKPGRAFVDQCNKQPMPDYGMALYIPAVTGDSAVAIQESAPGTGEGSGVTETDPTATYLTANLQTEAGQVTVSQQLLDRAGPNFAFDRLVFDQLTRDYNAAADQFVLTASLANAGTVAYGGSAFVLTDPGSTYALGDVGPSFYSKVSKAKATVRTAAGVVMDPTHLFVDPRRWEVIAASVDTLGRPLVVPNFAGPYNAAGAGSSTGKVGYEGDTGYVLNGLPVFHDLNIPAPSQGQDQAIVGALDEIYVWEGQLIPRVIPQTFAQNLQVLLQVYAYIACIPRYPAAVQTITGGAMTLPW